MNKLSQLIINNSVWDSVIDNSNRSTTATTKLEEHLKDFSVENSILIQADRRMSSELLYLSQKSIIEYELINFVKALDPRIEGEPLDCLNYLKRIVGGLLEENDNINYALEASEGILKEGANHFINREKVLQRKLIQVEDDKQKYDEKIKKHGIYIGELEEMINQMIREYINVLLSKEAINGELKLAKAGMISIKDEVKVKELNGEETDTDYLNDNEKLKLELLRMKEEKERIEVEKKSLEMIVMVNNRLYDRQSDPEYASFGEVKEAGSSFSDENKAGLLFVEKLREQELKIKELEAENNELRVNNVKLDRTLKDHQKENEMKKEVFNEHINELRLALNEIENHIDLSSIMYNRLNTSVLTRPEFCELPESPMRSIDNLKIIVEKLDNENMYIKNIYEKSLTLLSELKSQVSIERFGETANLAKEKRCFVCKEEGYGERVKIYEIALIEAGRDLKRACEMNDGLRDELELVKNKFIDYKEENEKFEFEVKRCLENYKEHDKEVSENLMELTEKEGLGIYELAQMYVNTKRDVFEVINMFENKQDVF